MSKMTVIQLLNKIANGEEDDLITEFEFDKRVWNFKALNDSEFCLDGWLLNQNITITKHKEILEEEKKITKKDFEQLGYALGSIQKCISKGYNKALEEHKIPEKLELKDNWCRKKGDYIITDYEINPLILNKINELIDYLKSKGE